VHSVLSACCEESAVLEYNTGFSYVQITSLTDLAAMETSVGKEPALQMSSLPELAAVEPSVGEASVGKEPGMAEVGARRRLFKEVIIELVGFTS